MQLSPGNGTTGAEAPGHVLLPRKLIEVLDVGGAKIWEGSDGSGQSVLLLWREESGCAFDHSPNVL